MIFDKLNGNILQWLRGFYFTVLAGGVSKAADRMDVKQSTVSHHIRNLEESLNVQLFFRHHKELELTEAGRNLYEQVIPLFEHVKLVLDSASRSPGELKGTIRLATTHAIAEFFLSPTIQFFRKKHPDVRFFIHGGGFGSITEAVVDGSVDFGIVSQGEFSDLLTFRPLFSSRLVVISPRGNPFGLPKTPSLHHICKPPFISFPPRGTIDTTIRHLLQANNQEFNSVISANTFYLLLEYVRLGIGITILDFFAVERRAKEFDIFEIADKLPDRQYVIIWRKNKKFSDQTKHYIDLLISSPTP